MGEDVKWIKIKVGMFDGNSFKRIKRAKIDGVTDFRDKLTAVWFELLDLSGKVNNDGFLMNDEIAFRSYEDISIALDRTEKEVSMCINWYIDNNMMEIIDSLFLISNWSKYQNEDGLRKLRLKNAERQKKFRETQRHKLLELNESDNVTVTSRVTSRNDNPLILTLNSNNDNINNSYNNKHINKYKSICDQIEEYTTDEELKMVLNQFVEMRKKNKKPLTDYAFHLILSSLDKKGGEDNYLKKDLLNQSILNGWQDVYELKNDYQRKYDKPKVATPQWYEGYKRDINKTEAISKQDIPTSKELNKLVDGMFD